VLVLALDTTTRAGSVAVLRDGAVVGTLAGDPATTHGARLPPDLMQALEAAGASLPEIDLLAVAAGPGSFTGLRVGIASMQGLAMAIGRRIVAVSALDALALSAGAVERDGRPIAAWMDAQRGEVFAALYDPSGRRLLVDATADTPVQTIERWRALDGPTAPPRFVGDGAVRYASEIRQAFGEGVEIGEPPPLAPIVGRLAFEHPERAVAPHAVVPIYIRRPDAEIARARRQDPRHAR
jgi:tRNA threonylcarbamoyladenosine biosynthesis protein TsaB